MMRDGGQGIPSREDGKCLPSLRGHGQEDGEKGVKERGEQNMAAAPILCPQAALGFLTNIHCSHHF